MVTLYSVCHIHNHSKSIEQLGIKTNSTLMKLYVILWTGESLTVIMQLTLFIIPRGVGMKAGVSKITLEKYYIGYNALYFFQYTICAGLDLLVLYAYFRLGRRLSTRAVSMVAKNLRKATLQAELAEAEKTQT